ncbi:helix-turn-helix transcriptional regulator [Actinomadura sp. KC06]|uniref:helix-turn-helix domain-containing protein n=1 Tax=Actinomadura sp. KC06 TaxID=2530369 RepID=UPI001405542C|nr:helix-turn-helix transcriptional regulator [Actinomadura sp. KC06]
MASRITHGPAIKAIRKALGIRQDALAQQVGISKSYLSRIENAVEVPELNATTKRLADRLGVPLDAITYPVPDAALLQESA